MLTVYHRLKLYCMISTEDSISCLYSYTSGTLIHQNIFRPSQSSENTPNFDSITQTTVAIVISATGVSTSQNLNISNAKIRLYRIQ